MILTSWLYSRKTWKLRSFLSTGWAATRHKKTSCMATVFLKMARYSLCDNTKRAMWWLIQHVKQLWGQQLLSVLTHASSSCFIFVNSSLVMDPSPSPSFCSFSLDASKSGLGGAGGICNNNTWKQPDAYGSTLKPAHTLSGLWCRFDNSVAHACLLFC